MQYPSYCTGCESGPPVLLCSADVSKALALENSNAILFYHSKTSLYQYTILFYNTFTSQNSIFIKILFFNPFFIISFQPFSLIFLGFSTAIFIPLSSSTGSTHNTHPWYTNQPIHAANLKPRPLIKNRSKPIQKKSSPEQTHSKNIITGANPFKKQHHRSHRSKPIQKKSSPEPLEQIHSKKWERWESRWRAETREKMESRDERANPFKKHHHRSHRSKPSKKKHHWSHRSKSIQKNERDEREDGEQRREREKSTEKMREMRDKGERVEIKYIIFDTILATVQFYV